MGKKRDVFDNKPPSKRGRNMRRQILSVLAGMIIFILGLAILASDVGAAPPMYELPIHEPKRGVKLGDTFG